MEAIQNENKREREREGILAGTLTLTSTEKKIGNGREREKKREKMCLLVDFIRCARASVSHFWKVCNDLKVFTFLGEKFWGFFPFSSSFLSSHFVVARALGVWKCTKEKGRERKRERMCFKSIDSEFQPIPTAVHFFFFLSLVCVSLTASAASSSRSTNHSSRQ